MIVTFNIMFKLYEVKRYAGLDIGYVPAGPRAFFRQSGQFGPQQFIFCWPAGPVTFISVVKTCTTFSVDLSRARGFLIRDLPSPS